MTVLAAILFGSQISGGSDHQSDKDLLVICEPKSKKEAIKKYVDLGFSVSAYTLSQLEFMRSHGSLFLQHLKHESQTLHDKAGIFKRFISDCCFIPPSIDEIERSKKTIINALKCPVGSKSSWWLADYLFVLSRDYLIKYFAKSGRIIFNVNQLSHEIKSEFLLSQNEVGIFLELRKCKSIYRSGRTESTSVTAILVAWGNVLTKILNISPVSHVSRFHYLNNRKAYDFESAYALLRYVESLRVMFPNIECNKNYEHQISKMILNPNHYSSTSAKRKKFLSLYLEEFRKQAAKCVNADSQKWSGFRSVSATPLLTSGYA